MGLWKRGKQYWLDVVVNGERYREPLGTTDWRRAKELEKSRIAELQKRPPDPTKRARTFSALSIAAAIETYADERRAQGYRLTLRTRLRSRSRELGHM